MLSSSKAGGSSATMDGVTAATSALLCALRLSSGAGEIRAGDSPAAAAAAAAAAVAGDCDVTPSGGAVRGPKLSPVCDANAWLIGTGVEAVGSRTCEGTRSVRRAFELSESVLSWVREERPSRLRRQLFSMCSTRQEVKPPARDR